jgi:hypothetical protein
MCSRVAAAGMMSRGLWPSDHDLSTASCAGLGAACLKTCFANLPDAGDLLIRNDRLDACQSAPLGIGRKGGRGRLPFHKS